MSIFSGFNASTAKHLQLDAGAFLRDYDVNTDTWETAKDTKCIGATSGGGNFSAVPTIRGVEIDGVKGAAKGLQNIDTWTVTLTANVKEFTAEAMKMALGAADAGSDNAPEGYTRISGRSELKDADYLDNLTWVGRLSGSGKPVIIVVKNALSTNGLSISFADKSEGLIPITVTGHYTAADLESPPFDIFYPTVE